MTPTAASPHITPHRIGGAVLSALSLAVIAWSTLRSHPSPTGIAATASWSAFDVALNTVLFLPLGAGLALLGLRSWVGVAVGGLLSIVIECAQWSWVSGRFASPVDVAANLAGAALGVLIIARWEDRARWWRLVAPGLAAGVVLAWFLGGYLAQPAIPGAASWTVQLGPDQAGAGAWGAAVIAMDLQGESLSEGNVTNVPTLRARLMASRLTRLRAQIVTGPSSGGPSRLVEVVVGQGLVPFLILAQDGRRLLAYQRTGLAWVGLRGPLIELDEGLPVGAGDTVGVRLEATRREIRLVAVHAGVERASSFRLSPDLYWSALLSRATDGALWWSLVPAMVSFVLLGLALASRPKTLVVVGFASLFLSAVGGGCAFPAWPVVSATVLGGLVGRRLGSSLGLFR